MSRDLPAILADLDPTRYEYEAWVERVAIDRLIAELFATEQPDQGTAILFQIFERFPNEDGYGGFWAVLHALERISGYENSLVDSVRWQPSSFAVLMINRLLNAGVTLVGRVGLIQLLAEVIANPRTSPEVRQDAQRFLQRHQH
jgi:hypothetical protein